jgi:flagellar hook-length control protein FliK
VQQAAGRPAGTNDAGLANRIQVVQATAARTPVGAGAAINLAVPQPAEPGDGKSPTIGHGLFDSGSAPAAVTGASPVPLGALTGGVGGSPQSPGPSSAAGLSPSPFAGQTPAVPATATALAASVMAMSQSGQSTAVLRLDPPGLGSLSIHIALTANATVNVVFVPSVPQTAQLIHSALPDLHHAMASAGLSLGETQVGGGAGGNPNGQARNQTGDGSRFAQTTMLSRATSGADPALAKDALRGARAVA